MNTTNKKVRTRLKMSVCALALTGVLSINTFPAFAIEIKTDTQASSQVEKNAQEKTAEKRKEIVSEAVSALNDTQSALKALDENDSKKALSILQGVTGKLEIILARDPSLKLVPAGVSAETYTVIGSVDNVKNMRDQAKQLLNDGNVQEARRLLQTLVSETDVNTINIPLATYPAAIKQAARLIDAGDTEGAKNILQTALNTVVVTQAIIPIPVVTAQAMLKDAEKLAENKQRTDEDNKHLTELLNGAQTSIKLAQELGYGQKQDFAHFYDEIDRIRDKTAGGKSGAGFFDSIKSYMTAMTKNSQHTEATSKP